MQAETSKPGDASWVSPPETTVVEGADTGAEENRTPPPDVEHPWPEYTCHKKVRAAKIQCVGAPRMNGCHLTLYGIEDTFSVSHEWYTHHNPQEGGYLVEYADGYLSFSPAEAFEGGYSDVVK